MSPTAIDPRAAAALLQPGDAYRAGGGDLRADVEIALELGPDRAIAGYGVAEIDGIGSVRVSTA